MFFLTKLMQQKVIRNFEKQSTALSQELETIRLKSISLKAQLKAVESQMQQKVIF